MEARSGSSLSYMRLCLKNKNYQLGSGGTCLLSQQSAETGEFEASMVYRVSSRAAEVHGEILCVWGGDILNYLSAV